MINWGSFGTPMDRFERRMNQLFNHFYQDFPQLTRPFSTDVWERGSRAGGQVNTISPAVDIYETDKSWHVHAELPGVKKEDVKIDLSSDTLTISAESKFSNEYTKDNVRYQERREGLFSRSLSVPDNIDRDKIQAKFENGVLMIDMPKNAEAKPIKKIIIE